MMKSLYLIIILFLLNSCFKIEEKRIENNNASASIVLGEKYLQQVFYNLNNQSIISQNNREIWDLAFYSGENGYHIKLNAAKIKMKAYNTGSTKFNQIQELKPEWTKKIDDPKGNLQNLALDINFTTGNFDTIQTGKIVYIIQLGLNENGEDLGFKKFVVEKIFNEKYFIKYANLDGSNQNTFEIMKDPTLNYVSFSFYNNGEIVSVEPNKNTWDLVFTHSTDKAISINLQDTIFDYSVTSVLLNPFYTKAYLEEVLNYEDFEINNIIETKFTNQLNIIGYDWKQLNDYGNVVYEIRKNKLYLIKDINSFIYKLKFISFYDPESNDKGTISFDYQIIK